MLSQEKIARANHILTSAKLEAYDSCADSNSNTKRTYAAIKRVLIDCNSLHAALYAFMSDTVCEAFGDFEPGRLRAEFLEDSIRSLDDSGRIELVQDLLAYALSTESAKQEYRAVLLAHQVLDTTLNLPEGSEVWHFYKVLKAAVFQAAIPLDECAETGSLHKTAGILLRLVRAS